MRCIDWVLLPSNIIHQAEFRAVIEHWGNSSLRRLQRRVSPLVEPNTLRQFFQRQLAESTFDDSVSHCLMVQSLLPTL